MKTLLVDGDWNLKKNFMSKRGFNANGHPCGGVFGFINSLKHTIDRLLPDRVIVMWDGENSGALRYKIYKQYKSKRKSKWKMENLSSSDQYGKNEKMQQEFEIYKQRVAVQSYLEDMFIRQVEVINVEADDLIGQYILTSDIPNEHIYIYSKDKDFRQLVSDNVSMLNSTNFEIITRGNFIEKVGHTIDNELLLKCFDGDSADEIKGIKGISPKGLLEKFPLMKHEKYTYNRLVEEAEEKRKNHKIKFYDKIIEAKEILYRNATLMDLKRPFLTDEAKKEVDNIMHAPLEFRFRSVDTAIRDFMKDGFNRFVEASLIMPFFATFYRIKTKEQEFAEN